MHKPAFFVSIGVIIFCFYFEHRDYFSIWLSEGSMLSYSDIYYLYVVPFEFGLFFYLIPLAAIPPAALSVIDDLSSGNMRFRMYRTTHNKYAMYKLSTISIGSMLPTLIGCAIFFLFTLCIAPLEGDSGISWRNEAIGRTMEWFTQSWYGFPYMVEITVRAVITAWLWGLIGTLIALLCLKKGDTLIYGFLLFWGLDCICYFVGLRNWRPYLLFFTSANYTGSLAWRYAQNALLILLFTCADWLLLNYRNRRL